MLLKKGFFELSLKFHIWSSCNYVKNWPLGLPLQHLLKINYCSFSSNADFKGYGSPVPDLRSNETSNTVESLAKIIAQEDMPIQIANPYERDRKVCLLCKYSIQLDYKNPKLLSQFVSPFTGQVYERHITRLCSKQHQILKMEIRKSVAAGLMPVMIKSVEFLKDPPICDPSNPIRPHKW